MSEEVPEVPEKHIRVYNLYCENLKAADINGFSDPFLILRVGDPEKHKRSDKGEHKTEIVKKNLNPVFDEQEFRIRVTDPEKECLIIDIYDFDKFTSNDYLGTAILPLSNLDKHPRQHAFHFGLVKGKGSIGLRLQANGFGKYEDGSGKRITERSLAPFKSGTLWGQVHGCDHIYPKGLKKGETARAYLVFVVEKKERKSIGSGKVVTRPYTPGVGKKPGKQKKKADGTTHKTTPHLEWSYESFKVEVDDMMKEYLNIELVKKGRSFIDDRMIGYGSYKLDKLVKGEKLELEDIPIYVKGAAYGRVAKLKIQLDSRKFGHFVKQEEEEEEEGEN